MRFFNNPELRMMNDAEIAMTLLNRWDHERFQGNAGMTFSVRAVYLSAIVVALLAVSKTALDALRLNASRLPTAHALCD